MAAADALITMSAAVRHRTMASSTLRCTHAKCDLCFSQNLLPTARTMSATSRVGRLISSSTSWNASPHRDSKLRLLPAGSEPLADGAGKDEGRVRYRRSWHGQAEPGWRAGRHRLPACASRSCVDYVSGYIADTIYPP